VTRFEIGSDVRCSDGPCGRLLSLVVNPISRAVTDLVVEPTHRFGLGRLVPITLVEGTEDGITLRCTKAQFDDLDMAEENQFLSDAGTEWGVDGQVMVWPYYALDHGSTALLQDYGGNAPQLITFESLPPGEVAVHRGDRVHALDGEIGRVQGLIIDPRDNRVSHVLLQEGHFFGRKEVAIPISSVESVDDGIKLRVTKDQILELPPVGLNPA
jgi:sporulation protein YlmC with PRC-barrel domain